MSEDNFFPGADRMAGYNEGGQHVPAPAPRQEIPPVAPQPPVIRPAPSWKAPSVTGDQLRRRATEDLGKPAPPAKKVFGNKKAQARYQAELAAWEQAKQHRQMRARSGGRSKTIMVVNTKGGVGKTPAVLCLTHAIANARQDGSVAAWEAADEQGTLLHRVGGDPGLGIVELLRNARELLANPSQVVLDSYAARLSTGGRVFGSPAERDLLREADVETIHGILSRTYDITIMDTANALRSPAARQAAELADALVLPLTVNLDAAARMLDIWELFANGDPVGRVPHRPELLKRAVVLLSHAEPPEMENPEAARVIRDSINALGAPFLEVPYDKHIKHSVELEWTQLTQQSRDAWTNVGATLISAVQDLHD